MSVRGGSNLQFTYGGREYDLVADSGATIMLGGFSNETKLTGNGAIHTSQNRETAGFTGLGISVDNSRQDLEALQAAINDGQAVPMALTVPGGVVYAGNLVPEGKVEFDTSEGTTEISGLGRRFEQI